ncbi:MAG: hypothetical protein IGS54_16020 [Elainella sp. C42_A2020_010]|nr:hypothetical protein [Elainella sp. C42_A2020_010]
MNARHTGHTGQKVLAKAAVWLAGEILLTLIGLDTLADYGEFLLTHTPESPLPEPTPICLCIG